VVVDDLDVFGPCWSPAEADPPLLVDPDAVLPGTVAAQLLKPMARRDPHIFECLGCVQDDRTAGRFAISLR
jgi:hypothetical protein